MPLKRSSQSLTATHDSKCRICGKSIQNEASIKRHERYCRKRLTHPVPPRRKSCLACIRAKSRCDSYTPACGPCQQKGRSCIYSSESLFSREDPFILLPTQSSPEQQSPNVPTAVPIARQVVAQSTSLDAGMFVTFEASPLGIAPDPTLSVSSESSHCTSAEYAAATKLVLRKSDMSFTLKPSDKRCPVASHLLRPRDGYPAKMELVSKLVSKMICSFPERRMIEDACPPFIHHSTFRRPANPTSSEDPIIICQDITRKYAAHKVRGDFSIWDAIASEQERIYDQRGSFDKWLHLSSAQAITIYLIMLAVEGESVLTHHPNLPITLLFTLGSNFEQLNRIHPGFMSAKEQIGDRPAWEDWIFAESKLRTAMVYFILALNFDVNFGLPCDREGGYEFEDVDLPAARILWEARNELSWREEFDLIQRTQDNFIPVRTIEGRLKYGDLMRLNKQHCGYEYSDIQKDESRLADRVDKWQNGMDEFGMLVALCSTMV